MIGILTSAKLTSYRIEQLEKRVRGHNNLIERTYKLEERAQLQEEKMKVANHRIEDNGELDKTLRRELSLTTGTLSYLSFAGLAAWRTR